MICVWPFRLRFMPLRSPAGPSLRSGLARSAASAERAPQSVLGLVRSYMILILIESIEGKGAGAWQPSSCWSGCRRNWRGG